MNTQTAKRTKKTSASELTDISTVKLVPLQLIDTLPQLRKEFDQASIEELAIDIKEHGLLQPILLKPVNDRYQVIAGERRLRAVMLNGSPGIPALLVKASSESTLMMQLAENIQRENLSLEEECNAVVLLYENMGSLAKVAKAVRKSVPWCSKRFAMTQNKLNHMARRMLENGITEDIELLKAFSSLIDFIGWAECNEWEKKITRGEAGRNEVRAALKIAKDTAKAAKEKQAANTEKSSHAKPKEPAPPPAWAVDHAIDDLSVALSDKSDSLTATELFNTWTEEQQQEVFRKLEDACNLGRNADSFKTISGLIMNGVWKSPYNDVELTAMVWGFGGKTFELMPFLAELQTPREKA